MAAPGQAVLKDIAITSARQAAGLEGKETPNGLEDMVGSQIVKTIVFRECLAFRLSGNHQHDKGIRSGPVKVGVFDEETGGGRDPTLICRFFLYFAAT